MDQSLRDAAEQGSIDALYALIQIDAKVLDRMDDIPFAETPLHIAAFAGHTQFAMEVMKLKPSFARKLNQAGFSPMHRALQKLLERENLQKPHACELENPDSQTKETQLFIKKQTQLVYQLLDVDKDLVRVHGREGVTPLHYVVQKGKLDLLKKFLKVCPKSLEDVTIRRETVLHIALKYEMVEAFPILIIWVRRTLGEKLLKWQDDEGNTLLHVAISKKLDKVVSPLLDTGFVDIYAENLEGQTAFDILKVQTNEPDQRKNDKEYNRCLWKLQIINKLPRPLRRFTFLLSPFKIFEWQNDVMMRRARALITDDPERLNALLIVGALLITVTFQAALTPPKSWQNLFLSLNALTYCLTSIALFGLIPPGFIGYLLHELLLLLLACFCVSTLVITTHHKIFIGLSFLFGYTLYTLLFYLVRAFSS